MSGYLGQIFGRRWAKPVIAVVVALVVAAGAAAYFTSAGSGTATGSVGSPLELTITAVTPTDGFLYPDGTGAVDLTISNPNEFPVRVNSLVQDGTIAVDGGHSGCSPSKVHYSTQNNGGAGWDVPKKVGVTDGALDLHLVGALSMDDDAENACQGATFTIPLATGP